MPKRLVFIIVIVAATAGVLLFIFRNNDHRECSNRTQSGRDSRGNLTVLKEHVCKEKFSL